MGTKRNLTCDNEFTNLQIVENLQKDYNLTILGTCLQTPRKTCWGKYVGVLLKYYCGNILKNNYNSTTTLSSTPGS